MQEAGYGDGHAVRTTPSQRLSNRQLANLCFGLFGVQIVWGLQNANTSRIFQTLGARVDDLPIPFSPFD